MKKLTNAQITSMQTALQEICDWYHNLQPITVTAKETALFDMDTIMGFTYIGAFKNPLAVERIPKVVELYAAATKNAVPIVRAIEDHTGDSLEFETHPPHGIKGTDEVKPIPELSDFKVDLIVHKNSTNAFHEESLRNWLGSRPHINTVIICGFVTDICVMQPAISIKTYCNNIGRKLRVIICEPAVASFELNVGDINVNHNAELSHLMALRFMHGAGIIIASDVIIE